MWSLKHYSHLILILLTIDFTAPYKLFFLFHETARGKETLSCVQLLCIHVLKNRTTLL